MSARGGSRPPPRGRPNKVTKAAATTAGLKRDPVALARASAVAARHSSSVVDHQLEQLAHDAEAEAEHEDDDEITAPQPHHTSQQHQQHHQQQQHHHQNPFDLAAAGILANGPPPPDADIHPDLHGLPPQFAMEAPMGSHGGGMNRTAEDFASESGYGQLVIDSALAKRLANNEGQRLAVQRRQDQSLNLKRRSNVEALLAHVSGQEAHSPLNGQMCGSCANCWFNASGSRCSFHENNLPQHMPAIQLQPVPVSANASFAGNAPMAPGMAPAGPGGFGQPGADASVAELAKEMFDKATAAIRSNDPHVRFQFRIETAARELAQASAEYADFLTQQGLDLQQHPQDAEGSVPDAAMGEDDNGA
ncbi:hypothetical protein CkaCkLH20_05057 [Colletotrichum karsti]|uniref:Uncharacterized protein n=1 Tax=Colletotrichum karsti TaxID=1095194 RepID=A0A9P6I7V2_9PEZI|nr:uncharacterized protein CkaCkLH20_05057 [Colletotrichum karsti]KAF9877357.1 hypothetical protein CkaCkLH20_05057 [Colletotrichum karsti]